MIGGGVVLPIAARGLAVQNRHAARAEAKPQEQDRSHAPRARAARRLARRGCNRGGGGARVARRSIPGAQPVQRRIQRRETGRKHRIDLEPGGDARLFVGGQFAVEKGRQPFVGDVLIVVGHCAASPSVIRSFKVLRAAASRLITVPIGMSSTSAASR